MSFRSLLGSAYVVLNFALIPPAFAEDRTFASLLARAEAQAAAGHRWAPPGDNVTETVVDMMNLISSATPEQLSELAALLEDPPKPSPSPTPRDDVRTAIAPPAAQRTPVIPSFTPAQPLALAPAAPALVATTPVRPAVSPQAIETAAAVPLQPPVRPGSQLSPASGPRAKELLSRGQAAERLGDVSAARRFYSTAAQQGDPTAARSLGRLYDPVYLRQAALGGIDPNPELARYWYEQATVLGDAEAGPLLKSMSVR